MTLEQLRIFVAVAERQHVTQAAQALHLTQSAVSAAVAAIESRYGVTLFDRVGRGIRLTETGRRFLSEARAVLARASEAETVLFDLSALKIGSLALSASQTVGNYWLPPLLQRFRAGNAGIALSLTLGNTESVREAVHEGRIDLGFIEGPIDDPLLSVTAIADDEMVMVAKPGLLAARRRLTAADLGRIAWVLREHGSATRVILEDALSKAGVPLAALEIALELPSNEAVRAAVEAGAGATILSRHAVDGSLRSGVLERLPFVLPKRHFYVLRHKQRYVSAAAEAFLALIRDKRPFKRPASPASA
jgi:DNA-binding transcriptional LysR family regulator